MKNKKSISVIIALICICIGSIIMLLKNYSPEDTSEFADITAPVSESTAIQTEAEENESQPAETEAETGAEAEAETEAVTEEATTNELSNDAYVEYRFRTKKQLEQHFEKHGSEFASDFGYETAKEYEKGASDVINNPEALYKTEAEDGDGVYYIEATNEFVVLSTDGYIRTYFRPNSGIKYFNKQ